MTPPRSSATDLSVEIPLPHPVRNNHLVAVVAVNYKHLGATHTRVEGLMAFLRLSKLVISTNVVSTLEIDAIRRKNRLVPEI